jgi:hypothetical protein
MYFGDDFQKFRYQNFIQEVNYTVSKEKITRIKNGNSDFRKSGIHNAKIPLFTGVAIRQML